MAIIANRFSLLFLLLIPVSSVSLFHKRHLFLLLVLVLFLLFSQIVLSIHLIGEEEIIKTTTKRTIPIHLNTLLLLSSVTKRKDIGQSSCNNYLDTSSNNSIRHDYSFDYKSNMNSFNSLFSSSSSSSSLPTLFLQRKLRNDIIFSINRNKLCRIVNWPKHEMMKSFSSSSSSSLAFVSSQIEMKRQQLYSDKTNNCYHQPLRLIHDSITLSQQQKFAGTPFSKSIPSIRRDRNVLLTRCMSMLSYHPISHVSSNRLVHRIQRRFIEPQIRQFRGKTKKSKNTNNNNKLGMQIDWDNIDDDDDDDDGTKPPVEYVNTESDEVVYDNTMQWLKRIVIGMNLCPFADKSLRLNQIEIIIARSNDEEEILKRVLLKMLYRETKPGTTLIVCPDLYPTNFLQFWNVVLLIEQGLLVQYDDLRGVVQVAPFHPLFRFGSSSSTDDSINKDQMNDNTVTTKNSKDESVNNDNDKDHDGEEDDEEDGDDEDVGDWTNRSPYPIFHILREVEVSAAVEKINGDASRVWLRNVNLLHELENKLGRTTFEQFMKLNLRTEELTQEQAAIVQQALRKFRGYLSSS